jgi:hypothetical protein
VTPERARSSTEISVHEAVLRALEPHGRGVAVVELVWLGQADMWFTEVRPSQRGAAPLSIAVQGDDDELNLTVSRTWMEVWNVGDLAEWTFDLAEAVFAGRLEEAGRGGHAFARVYTRHGVEVGGRMHLPWPWRWRRPRRFEPYSGQPGSVST